MTSPGSVPPIQASCNRWEVSCAQSKISAQSSMMNLHFASSPIAKMEKNSCKENKQGNLRFVWRKSSLFEDVFPDQLLRYLVFVQPNLICSLMQHYHCFTTIASSYPQNSWSNEASNLGKLRYACETSSDAQSSLLLSCLLDDGHLCVMMMSDQWCGFSGRINYSCCYLAVYYFRSSNSKMLLHLSWNSSSVLVAD